MTTADRATKIIQDALGIEGDAVVNYCFPKNLAGRSRTARCHHAGWLGEFSGSRYGHLFPRGDDGAELAAAEQAFLS